ncbi:tyrosine kinase receptor Cad96Ca isoform X1 [Anastrepha obliqua]|uniref:tyrosine kinase receptor Cad96Ca isoform X1 n=1 Tax=Anastrepha obliqua TaxID=95512 RepID=UPI002409DF1D|nr:tyrosine kinase receptor Cad96Ca isoform X1 [Anastrepha obliqua]XP_054738124.1 tyrosine kinase receptor Cad96Ca isoform X1 [Anastrepha obliqua]XP_054738133.1 tyrosine kinase receptor Cad96Ca isoform X1 [Anastrepha obliqua]XP_054738142.1 tyrosine kinase receptor Cad96Ca isoform X1 [Anastrepha obliqua]XP_054738150.1 tyrosine kinase receptor Cad96Ca isoform X1 [Anastrepha obliqua]XP_054738159.1 tyrosine kinase receptor Cad96Ca isoform X1 [Anastrepha obliqua]XP_054738165.1 tyrosine kinase rece
MIVKSDINALFTRTPLMSVTAIMIIRIISSFSKTNLWPLRHPKICLLTAVLHMEILTLLCLTQPVSSQQHSLVNTPPILYVPERNWRIPETEQVGQIITRIRAEDPENDELVFGLEPHNLFNYDDHSDKENLPFRIDPVRGIVYLNESLTGRGGENFFLYITVSDGDLTAKNEVFVNILAKDNDTVSNFRTPPSVTSVVQNFSQILPPFDTLPGVQSVRNKYSNDPPIHHLSSNFGLNQGIFTFHVPGSSSNHARQPPVFNLNPNQQDSSWPTASSNAVSNGLNSGTTIQTNTMMPTPTTIDSQGRIRLTPIKNANNNDYFNGVTNKNYNNFNNDSGSKSNVKEKLPSSTVNVISNDKDLSNKNPSANYSIKAFVVPVIVISCGIFFAVAFFFGFLYRKRLCAISKKLKKKSKEEMAKKSNQSNLSSNLTDDSRNSMVMQHWNGPTAYNNRYVPWERDTQHIQDALAISQLSTNPMNRINHTGDPNMSGIFRGISYNNNSIIGTTENSLASNMTYGSAVVGNTAGDGKCRWEFPRHRLKFFNILGEGAFGQVWRCEAIDVDGAEGVTTVAVKTLKENATETEKKDLISELEVMKSLEPHINVVRLLGCCTDKDPIFVIIEFVNRGKLQTYLRNSRAERHYGNTHGKSNTLTSGDLTSFMYQVAKGMDYLTSRGIIHRDLAARNILITDDHTCKVADFGFARDVITSKIYERTSEGKLPIRWMAVESLYDNIFSIKSDIWSFGVLMWEIVTLGSTPYPGISAADVMRKVRDGFRLEKPEHCRRELYNIMYYCWASDANERPTFVELVQMLDKLLHTEMDYIELERFPDHNYYNILNLSGEKL